MFVVAVLLLGLVVSRIVCVLANNSINKKNKHNYELPVFRGDWGCVCLSFCLLLS